MDAAWPKIADAFMRPQLGPQLDELDSLFSRFDQPPGGQYSGWYQYFDRDIRRLLGMPVAKPLKQQLLRWRSWPVPRGAATPGRIARSPSVRRAGSGDDT